MGSGPSSISGHADGDIANGVVRADALALRDLCRTLMPLKPVGGQSPDPEVSAVAYGGARAFREIAALNALVLAGLDATGQLHLSARTLTGGAVTADPQLVAAKLRGDIVQVPRAQVQRRQQSYEAAGALLGDMGSRSEGCSRHAQATNPILALVR